VPREVAFSLDRHTALGIQVAVAVVPGVGFVEIGQPVAVEGVDARVARLQHPLATRVDQAKEVAIERGRGHGQFAERLRGLEARLDHPAAIAVDESVALLPQHGAGQAASAEQAQLVETLRAGEAAFAVDDAPGVLAHLHGAQPVAERPRIFEARRYHHLAREVHEAPTPPLLEARHAVLGVVAGVFQRGRHAPAAFGIDIAPAAIVGFGGGDPAPLPVGVEAKQRLQPFGRADRAAWVHDGAGVAGAVGRQRDAGNPGGGCGGVLVHGFRFLRAGS